MGFLRKRKNNRYEDNKSREAIGEEAVDREVNYVEEEDDFSPAAVETRPDRSEFRAAAAENAVSAAEKPDAEEAADDNGAAESTAEAEIDGKPEVFDDSAETDRSEEGTAVSEQSDADMENAEDAAGDEAEEAYDDIDDFSDGSEELSEEPEEESVPEEDAVSAPKKDMKKAFKNFKKKNKKVFKGIGIGFCALAGVCLCVYVYGCLTIPEDTIFRNVYIENNDVGGLTREQAEEKLQSASLLGNTTITLRCGGQSYEINGADVGLSAKLEDTVDKAMRYGRTGNIFIDGFANTLQLFAKRNIIPNANADEAVLREKLSEFGKQIYGELVEHQLSLGEGVVTITPGHTGFDNNTDAAYEEVKTAIGNEQFSDINVTLNAGAPHDVTFEQIDSFTYLDPVDAYYDINGNDIMVIKEVEGRYLDRDEATNLISQVYEGGPEVNVPYYASYAAVTADELQSKLFNATIASYSTSYGTSTANRCANIARAASKINGTILAPGAVFSFNDTVGPRSVANGFYTAKEYVDGQTVDGIGGGTCQVSSTLYNAVLYSDLAIVTRTNHMFPVGYCPIGQDATVADSGVDFKFMNSMDYPIKISAVTSGYTITISIIGTQRDDPRTVKIQNSSTAVGADTSVHSVRYVYNSAGELIRTDDLGNSYYMSHEED